MRVRLRTWDKRFNDPAWAGDVAKPNPQHLDPATVAEMRGRRLQRYHVDPDPRDGDGRKTVIIHGKRVTELSPKQRWPHAELWGVTRCNVLYWRESLTDWDRWFDLHPVGSTPYHRGILAKRPEAWDWYTRQPAGRPIYLLDANPNVPASVTFPRQWVQDTLRTSRFTVSVDWMIGLALCEGFERIVLNGIGTRMEPDFQYAHQGILYWLGYAEGRGIDLVIEGPSCYRAPEKVYGYEAGAPEWEKAPALAGV
jgi:hypothetical protein